MRRATSIVQERDTLYRKQYVGGGVWRYSILEKGSATPPSHPMVERIGDGWFGHMPIVDPRQVLAVFPELAGRAWLLVGGVIELPEKELQNGPTRS